jgi:hypothetical protein
LACRFTIRQHQIWLLQRCRLGRFVMTHENAPPASVCSLGAA